MSHSEDGQCTCQKAENTLKICLVELKNSRKHLQQAVDTSNPTENTDELIQTAKDLCEIAQGMTDHNLKENLPQLANLVEEVENQVDALKEEVEELLIHITNIK